MVVVCDGHDKEDNNAIARRLDDGGLCLVMVREIGTEIRERVRSQCLCFRDNQMAYEHRALTRDSCLQIRNAFE